MIEFRQVSKSYRSKNTHKTILCQTNLVLPTSTNIGILGRNGAGKSTLMRLMSGAECPDTGSVIRNGRVSWPLGFSGGFNGSMTGLENVRFVARIYGQDPDYVANFVDHFAELGHSMKLPVRQYSSGMKARLAFGLSMAIDFDCYLVDEITAVGDKNFRDKSKELFSHRLNNRSLIMISHSMDSLREYCESALLLEAGQLYYYDRIEEAIADYQALLTK